MNTVIVTGSAGAIGRSLVPLLRIQPGTEVETERLPRNATHLIHLPGEVALDASPGEARAAIVERLQEVIEFARGCPKLRSLSLLSTLGVAGDTQGRIAEEPMTRPGRFRSPQDAAFAEAEGILLKSGLPVTIYRVGDFDDDSIARAIQFAYDRRSAVGRIFHFCSPREAVETSRTLAYFSAANRETVHAGV